LNAINDFTNENVETAFKSFLEEKGLGFGAVLPLYRLLITGKGMGPSMFEISSFLGKDECLSRMEAGMTKVVSIKDSINA
jgi:glutamyl-tRNA synthetase